MEVKVVKTPPQVVTEEQLDNLVKIHRSTQLFHWVVVAEVLKKELALEAMEHMDQEAAPELATVGIVVSLAAQEHRVKEIPVEVEHQLKMVWAVVEVVPEALVNQVFKALAVVV
jgi:hypothetical protein